MTVGRARAPAATLSRLSVVVVVIRAGPGLVVARVHVWTMRACTRARDTRLRVGGGWVTYESAGHTATELARYGCLFNMCNRQRAQIQSIKSINDSIVRSRRDTCASS